VLTNRDVIKTFSKEIAKTAAKDYIWSGVKESIKTIGNLLQPFRQPEPFKWSDPVFHGAAVVIFITAPKDSQWVALDVGMCSQNMMLAPKALRPYISAVGLAKFVAHTDIFYRLRIPATEQVRLAVILGYGDETAPAHERKRDNVLFVDRGEQVKMKRVLLL
jgi:hypothetical protein